MVDIPLVATDDERSRKVGQKSATNAYIVLSALLLAIVVQHVVVNGFADWSTVRLELIGFALGLVVYIASGLYYTRTM